ncbi:MAG: peptidyl-prolyl cis-trans isomerase [Acidimicrobiales bacterium]
MKRLLFLFLGVAVLVGLAAYYVPAPAARVGGSAVSRRSLGTDLQAIAGSTGYQCYLSEEKSLTAGRPESVQVQGVSTSGTGAYATAFADTWLSQMLTARVTAQLLDRHGVTVNPGDMTVGKSVLERRITGVLSTYARDSGSTAACGGSGKAVLASLPPSFVSEQVRAQTDQSLLEAHAVGAGIQGNQLASYFTAHRAEFDKVCLSVIVVATKKKADAVDLAIKGGTPFAQEAKASSIDSSTASSGGAAGCGVLAGTSLLGPLGHLATGKVSPPIAYNSSYLVAEVTSRTPVHFTTVANTVLTVLLLAGQHKADAEVASTLRSGAVTVDARFGHRKSGSSLIVPPSHPPLTSLLTARANTPGA